MSSSMKSADDYGTLPRPDDKQDSADNASDNSKGKTTTDRASISLHQLSSTSSSIIKQTIQRKVTLSSFLWHSHSVLGMTVPDNHITPPISAGPCPICCEIDPEGLTRRRRLFLFLVVFWVSTALAVQVSVGHHGSFYALCMMIGVVLPLVCHLKENLPTYSRWFKERGIGPIGRRPDGSDGIRFEELTLLLLFILSIMKLWHDYHGMGIKVLDNVLWIWFGSLVAEMCCLVFKYYFGKYCCFCFSCCVPNTYQYIGDDDDSDEDDNNDCDNVEEGGLV